MPLFPKREPDLGDLAAYIVEAARGRGITVNRGRLVKLLYLVDVERVRSRRQPVTGIAWILGRQGPSAAGLDAELRQLATREKESTQWGRSVVHNAFRDPSRGDDWIAGTKMLVDGVVRSYAGLDSDALSDYVDTRTGPMIDAVPGQPLSMDRARDDRRARRASPPEARPARGDIEER
jgi:hypothetical protein